MRMDWDLISMSQALFHQVLKHHFNKYLIEVKKNSMSDDKEDGVK
jgi:hypothetical protein